MEGWLIIWDIYPNGPTMAITQKQLEILMQEDKSIIWRDGNCLNKIQNAYLFQGWYMEINHRLNKRKGSDGTEWGRPSITVQKAVYLLG